MATTVARSGDAEQAPVVATIVVEMPRAGEEESRVARQKALRAFKRMQPRKAKKVGLMRCLAGCLAGSAGGVKDEDSDSDGYGRIVSCHAGPRFVFPKSLTAPATSPRSVTRAKSPTVPALHPALVHRLPPLKPRQRPSLKRISKPAAAPAPALPLVVLLQPPGTYSVQYYNIGLPRRTLGPSSPKVRSPRSARSPRASFTGSSNATSASPSLAGVSSNASPSSSVAADLHHANSGSAMHAEVQPQAETARPMEVLSRVSPRALQRRSCGLEEAQVQQAEAVRPMEVLSRVSPRALQRRSGGLEEAQPQQAEAVRPMEVLARVSPHALQRRSGGQPDSVPQIGKPAEAGKPAEDHAGSIANQSSVGAVNDQRFIVPASLLEIRQRQTMTASQAAAAAAAAIAAPAVQTLSTRSLSLPMSVKYEGVRPRMTSYDAVANRRERKWSSGSSEEGDVLERAARRVVNLLTRTELVDDKLGPNKEPARHIATPNIQEEEVEAVGSPVVAPCAAQAAYAFTEAWLQKAVPPRSLPMAEPLRIIEPAKPCGEESATVFAASPSAQPPQLAAQRSYSCASEASNRFLTHASSAAVEDLQSSDDDVEAGMAELEQQMQAWRSCPAMLAGGAGQQPRPAAAQTAAARPQLQRIVSFALSVGSEAASSGAPASEDCNRSEGVADEAQPGELAAYEAVPVGEAARQRMLARATSFALSIGSDVSTSAASFSSSRASEERIVPEVQAQQDAKFAVLAPAAQAKVAEVEVAMPEVPAASAPMTQAADAAASAPVTQAADAAVPAMQAQAQVAVLGHKAAAEKQVVEDLDMPQQLQPLDRTASDAASTDSYGAFSATSDVTSAGAAAEEAMEVEAQAAETDAATVADGAAPHQLQRLVSFAVSVSSNDAPTSPSELSSSSSNTIAIDIAEPAAAAPGARDAGVAAAEVDAMPPPQLLLQPQLARATSFALSIGSDDAFSSASSTAFTREGSALAVNNVSGTVEAQNTEPKVVPASTRSLGRAVSFAVSASSDALVSASSNCFSVATDFEGAQSQLVMPMPVPEHAASPAMSTGSNVSVPEAGSSAKQVAAGAAFAGDRRLDRAVSFAVAVGSELDSDSAAESACGAMPGHSQRQLGRLVSFAVEVSSGSDSSNSSVLQAAAGAAEQRRLGRLTSFAVDVGSQCSSNSSDAEASARARRYGRVTSFAVPVESTHNSINSGSEAGDEAQVGVLGRAKSFAISVSSESDSDMFL